MFHSKKFVSENISDIKYIEIINKLLIYKNAFRFCNESNVRKFCRFLIKKKTQKFVKSLFLPNVLRITITLFGPMILNAFTLFS